MIVRTPDAGAAAALLDGHVEQRDGDRLVVAEPDAAELNARLVTAGIRVTEISAERHSLEGLMLAVTSSGSDRVSRPGPGRDGDRR